MEEPSQQQLDLLPPDIRQMVLQLPSDKRAEVLKQLIQQTELSYRQLTSADVEVIKARTSQQSQFGFLPADVGFTWEEVSQGNFIALGAFDMQPVEGTEGGEGHTLQEVPVAFIIAELARVDHTLAYIDREMSSSDWPLSQGATYSTSDPSNQQGSQSTNPAAEAQGSQPTNPAAEASDRKASSLSPSSPITTVGLAMPSNPSVHTLAHEGGWQEDDMAVSVQYLGVDFEYRRQGIGRQLLDMVRDIGREAGARMLWLTVAEYNTQAVAFYSAYGFSQAAERRKGERGAHQLMVHVLPASTKRAPRLKKASKPKGRASKPKGKGFGAQALCTTCAYPNSCSVEAVSLAWPHAQSRVLPTRSNSVTSNQACRTRPLKTALAGARHVLRLAFV